MSKVETGREQGEDMPIVRLTCETNSLMDWERLGSSRVR